MEIRRTVARNVAWNWAGMVVGLAVGVVVMPFLIHRLGQVTYGLWILIGSLTNYFGLMDLGIRGSVGRYVAFHRAKNDADGVNRTLSTAIVILSGVALLAVIGTLALQVVFFEPFDVPADQVVSVRWALFIVGLNLALTFPLSVFDGTLWAFQRFDVLNRIDIPLHLARLGLTYWWIGSGGGLVALALITLGTTLAGGVAKGVLSFREDPRLRVNVRLLDRATAWALLAYGFWSFLQALAVMISTQMGLVITGAWLAVSYVTSYHIALRLANIVSAFLMAGTGVLTPVATAFHAADDHEQQKKLFLAGGRFCTAFTLYFVILLVFLGESLIRVWVGPSLLEAADLLVVMALGLVLPFSQRVTNSMILGMGKHKVMALVGLGESALSTGLAILAVKPFGLMGVCVAFVAGEFIARGVIQMVYGCRLVHVPLGRYVGQALLLPVSVALVPAAGLGLLTHWWKPESWPTLILTTAGFSLVYAAFVTVAFMPAFLRRRNRRRDAERDVYEEITALASTEGVVCRP